MTVQTLPRPDAARDDHRQLPGTIERDLFCTSCRYNMRGIGIHGRCPECGAPVVNTLVTLLERAGAATWRLPLEPKQLGTIRDGLLMILLGTTTWGLLLWMPQRMYEFRSTGRKFMLGIACTAWVLICCGMWKSGVRMFAPSGAVRDANPVLRRIFRSASAVLLFMPIAGAFAFDRYQPFISADLDFLAVPTAIALIVSIILIGPLLFLRIVRIARAVEAPATAGAAALVACLWPATGFIVMDVVRFGRIEVFNSLEFLSLVPLPPIGPPIYWREVWREWQWRGSPEFWVILLPSLLGIASAAIIVSCCGAVWMEKITRMREEPAATEDAR